MFARVEGKIRSSPDVLNPSITYSGIKMIKFNLAGKKSNSIRR
jgi:hypothetical protein